MFQSIWELALGLLLGAIHCQMSNDAHVTTTSAGMKYPKVSNIVATTIELCIHMSSLFSDHIDSSYRKPQNRIHYVHNQSLHTIASFLKYCSNSREKSDQYSHEVTKAALKNVM